MIKKYGKNYYFASLFFPKTLRQEVWEIYKFFRIPDEIVDSSPHLEDTEKQAALDDWKKKWPTTSAGEIFAKYGIPFDLADRFITAMESDIYKKNYESYEELEIYMSGSAGAVGEILTYILGYEKPEAFFYARKLGEAMQLTNFIRDVKEDKEALGRQYLDPAKMDFYIEKARALYRQADLGIPLLKRGRLAVKISSRLYESILDNKRSTKLWGKIKLSLSVVVSEVWPQPVSSQRGVFK